MRTLVQDQAFNMSCALVDSFSTAKMRKGMVTLTMEEGGWNLIAHLLDKIANGELVEKPAPQPQFSMTEILDHEVSILRTTGAIVSSDDIAAYRESRLTRP